MSKKKEDKEKIVYIDDNSTIADMSATKKYGTAPKRKSTTREKMATYFATVKAMLIPMICTLVAFVLLYVLLRLATGK